MWRTIKILIFIWPVPVMIYFMGMNFFDSMEVNEKLHEANGLAWGSGSELITVHVEKTYQDEQQIYELQLVGNGGQTLFNEKFFINIDSFGGGFIKAVQADDDPAFELLVWGASPYELEKSFLLDYTEGQIARREFKNLSADIQDLTKLWYQTHINSRKAIGYLGMLFIGYYILGGFSLLIIKTVRYFKKPMG
jgi:hypothetical protein